MTKTLYILTFCISNFVYFSRKKRSVSTTATWNPLNITNSFPLALLSLQTMTRCSNGSEDIPGLLALAAQMAFEVINDVTSLLLHY